MSAEGADWTCAPCAGKLFSMQRCELCRLALLLLWLCYRDPEQHANPRWNELIQIDDYRRRRLLLNVALFIHLILIAALTLIILGLTPCWPVLRWFVAFVYILVVGHYGSAVFLCALRTWFMGQRRESSAGVPGNLMGFFERLLFMGVVWFVASVYPDNVPAVAAAMGFWLGTKLLSGWNRATSDIPLQESDRRARGAMSALMTGTLNMGFATVSGLMGAGKVWF